MADVLAKLSFEERAAVLGRWGLEGVTPEQLPRRLLEDGLIQQRAGERGWMSGMMLPIDELMQHGLHREGTLAWEVVAALGAELGLPDRMAAQLGAMASTELDRLARALGLVPPSSRHGLLAELQRALLDGPRIAKAAATLPRGLRLRLAGTLEPAELEMLAQRQLALLPGRPCSDLAAAAATCARQLEADHQRTLLQVVRDTAHPAVARAPDQASPVTVLRAAALAVGASGFDPIQAAARSGIELHVTALAMALRDDGPALDLGHEMMLDRGLRFLVSPGAPTRMLAEDLLGIERGQSGLEVAHLAWLTLVQIANLPEGRPCGLDAMAALVAADAEALQLEYPELRPQVTLERARRYVMVQLASLLALGMAWVVPQQGVAIASEPLRVALQRLPAGAAPPGAGEPALATVRRQGDDLVVEAGELVPLQRLVGLAVHVLPRATGGQLQFQLTPALLVPSRREAVLAALNTAVG